VSFVGIGVLFGRLFRLAGVGCVGYCCGGGVSGVSGGSGP